MPWRVVRLALHLLPDSSAGVLSPQGGVLLPEPWRSTAAHASANAVVGHVVPGQRSAARWPPSRQQETQKEKAHLREEQRRAPWPRSQEFEQPRWQH